MTPMDVLLAAEQYHLETDIPLVIQGFILIALAALTYWNERRSAKNRAEENKEENRHDEHMAALIVKALKDEQDDDLKQFPRGVIQKGAPVAPGEPLDRDH